MNDGADEEPGGEAEPESSSEVQIGPAEAWRLDPEAAAPPDFSVVANERLIAYVWQGSEGELRRSKALTDEPPLELPFGDILVLDAEHAGTLRELAGKATELDRFRFAVELEGWSWHAGPYQPHARMRRF